MTDVHSTEYIAGVLWEQEATHQGIGSRRIRCQSKRGGVGWKGVPNSGSPSASPRAGNLLINLSLRSVPPGSDVTITLPVLCLRSISQPSQGLTPLRRQMKSERDSARESAPRPLPERCAARRLARGLVLTVGGHGLETGGLE